MDNDKKETDIVHKINEFEQKLHLRGSLTPKLGIQKSLNILEGLGFTTSMKSEVNYIEQNSKVRILSPFSRSQRVNLDSSPNKFGLLSSHQSNDMYINPSLKRIRFINRFLLTFILLAIIINFVVFFVL